MKIRKLLSSLIATTMLATMVSAFSVVKAAEAPVITAETGYDEENACIILDISYSGFENFVPYSKKIGKENVRGLSTIQGVVTVDSADSSKLSNGAIEFLGADTGNMSTSVNRDTTTSDDVFSYKMGFLATAKAQYDTNMTNNIATFYFAADKNETITFNLSDIKLIVEETVNNVASASVIYSVANGNLTCPETVTYGETVVEPEKTLNTTFANVAAKKDNASGNVTYGCEGVISGGLSFSKVVFTVKDITNDKTADYTWDLGTSIAAEDVAYGLNIWGVPAGVEIEVLNAVAQ